MNKRERILQAALRVATTEGVGKLSVRAVAAEAGVGATTLRNYFPSQALLMQAVTSQLVTHALSDLDILDVTKPPSTRLFECLAQFLPRSDEEELALYGWFELYRLALGSEANDGVRDLLVSGHESSARSMRRWLQALTEEGWTLSDDTDALVVRLIAFVEGLHLSLLLKPAVIDIAMANDALRWVTEGIVRAET